MNHTPGGRTPAEAFASNPAGFASQNVLGAYNMPGKYATTGGIPNVTPPTTHNPTVPAHQSIVTLGVDNQHGNSRLSAHPPGGAGPQAYLLPYQEAGNPSKPGGTAGIHGIPNTPRPGQPNLVVTEALNGCAVWGLHNKNDNTLTFLHDARFGSTKPDQLNNIKGYLKDNPNYRLVAGYTPQQYEKRYNADRPNEYTGATAFIHHDPAKGGWSIHGQPNMTTGLSPDGHFSLDRPPHPLVHTQNGVQSVPVSIHGPTLDPESFRVNHPPAGSPLLTPPPPAYFPE